MALSIFADALPYTEMHKEYSDWFPNMQLSEMIPNIAYSSSLHWQLYCNKYPDERGVLLDWVKKPEQNKSVRLVSSLLSQLSYFNNLVFLTKKILDRYVYRKNIFANIPVTVRSEFSNCSKYLFWDKKTYSKESIFDGYEVISQDEGHITFDTTMDRLEQAIRAHKRNIFLNTGFADSIGHTCDRGELYTNKLKPYMVRLQELISLYVKEFPNEEVLLVSDHGMSTVLHKVDYDIVGRFGKQGQNSYIAYADSCFLCVWSENKNLLSEISSFLNVQPEGHLMSDAERQYYHATSQKFGNLIYILKEGYVFKDNWFGRSLRKASPNGSGMHGHWPDRESRDQMATILLINGKRKLDSFYTYKTANKLITKIMQ